MNETTDTSEQPGLPGADPGPAPSGPPPAPRPPLRRSGSDRKVAGVAGGLGRYFDIDPLIFRVVFVTLAIFGGSGLLLYAVGWLLVPEDGSNESEASRLVNGRATPKIVGGILLAIFGLLVVGNYARTGFGFGGFTALAAIVIAAFLISRNGSDHPLVAPRQSPTPPPPSYYGPPPTQGAYGQTTGTAYAAAGSAAPTTPMGYPSPPPTTPTRYPPPPLPPYQSFAPPAQPPWTPPPPRPRSPLGRATLSATLVVAGALVAWNLASSHDVPVETVLAICLSIVGLGLVVGGFAGRARGLIFLGAVLMVATTAAGITHVGFRGGLGDRTWTPRTTAGLQDTYRLGVGQGILDLSRLQLAPGETVDLRVRQGIGHLTIVLPERVSADVTSDVNAGDIRWPNGTDNNGTSLHRRYISPRGTAPVITIDAQLGVGSMEVQRATS
jgi:phage shock protein PspC (stress-responsive transcriptional regulator)/predicted membrane protein